MFDETIQSSPEPKKRLHDSIAYRKSKRKRRNNETEISSINETNSTINLETKNFPLNAISCEYENENDVEIEFVLDDIDSEEKQLEIEIFDINNTTNLEIKNLPLSDISSECDEIEFDLDDIAAEEKLLELETSDINKTTNSTINLETKNLLLTTIYWEDDDDNDDQLEIIPPDDIFAEEKLLEKANHGNFKNTNNYEKFITKGFETVTQFRQKINLNSQLDNTEEVIIADPETQFNLSETLFDNLCNEIKTSDKLNVKFNPETYDTIGAGCSKFLSPIKKSTKLEKSFTDTITVPMPGPETQFGISESQFAIFCNDVEDELDEKYNKKCESPKIQTPIKIKPIYSLVQSISDDFSELEVSDIDIALANSSYSPIVKFQFHDKTLRTYSVVKTKLNLSPKKDLEISQQITENLLNLNSFFSDSLAEEIDVKDSTMLEYFHSKRNFNFSTSVNSIDEFEGFPISDNENAEQNKCSENLFDNKNENLDIYQEDIDIFNEHENKCKGFTQAVLEKSVIGIDNEIPVDSNSKNDFKNLSTVVCSTVLNQFSKNYNQYSETELPKDSINDDDIFNSELCKDEDIFMEIKTQNCIRSESNNNITNTIKTEYLNCQIPLKSKFNGLQSAIKTDEKLKEYSTPLTLKIQENQVENQIFQGFKFASKKPVIISENAIKQAEKLIAKVLTEDISNLEEEENKENNPILNEEKQKKAADIESIQINDDAYAKEFLNGIDIDSFTDDFHSDIEMSKYSPKKNQLSNDKSNSNSFAIKSNTSPPKDRLLEANNFLNGISAEITNVENSFNTVLRKSINKSEKSLLKVDQFINETNMEISDNLSKIDNNFKVPNFIGFTSGKGKPIKIPEKVLQKATKMMQVFNKEINSEIILQDFEENSLPIETNLIEAKKSIVETNLENSETENKITNLIETENSTANLENEVQEPKIVRKKRSNYQPNKIYSRRVTRSSSRINNMENTSLELLHVENGKNVLNNYTDRDTIPKQVSKNDNTNIKNISSEFNKTKSLINHKTDISTTSCEPLLHKRISRSQLLNSKPLGARRNILSLSQSNFKPSEKLITPSLDENGCTPLRNLQNNDKSLNYLETPNIKTLSTPKISSSQLTLTKDVTPSFIDLIKNNVNNSSFNDEMKLINWNEQVSNDLSQTLSLNSKTPIGATPLSTKRNLSLTRKSFKPPAKLITSFDENSCTPLRNLQNNFDKSLNCLDTPNLKEFFKSVQCVETSTPKISSLQVTPTNNAALMKNKINNSNEENRNLPPKTLNLNKKNGPSPKNRIGRLKMWNKPPTLLPIAFIDACKPSGLRRNTSFSNKLNNQSVKIKNKKDLQ